MTVRPIAAAAAALLLAACAAPPGVQAADGISGTMLVANKRANTLVRVDLATGEKTHEVPTCANPHELAVSPDRMHVALACYSGQELEILRTSDLVAVKRIELTEGARPHGVFWHANGTLFASAEGRGSIFAVDEPLGDGPVVREIGSGGAPGPHMVVVDEAGTFAWGTIIPTGTVVRYDLATGRETGRKVLGGQTEGIALAADGSALWVGANQAGKVYRLDPATLEVEAEIATGPVPIRVAAHPTGGWVVSSNFGEGGLTVIDTGSNSIARSVPVSGDQGPQQVTLVFSDDGQQLYAAETATQTVAEIDFASGTVLRRLPSGDGGDGLEVFE